jgi:hypothetical protein
MRMPFLGEQRHQEPVAQMLARAEDRRDLARIERAGDTAGDHQLDRPRGDWPALGHMMQERLARAPADPAPGDQVGGQPDTRTGLVVVEAEHARWRFTVAGERLPEPFPSTITFAAGALSHDTKRATSATPAPAHPTPAWARNSNQSFRLIAQARTVFGDRSSAARYARYASAGTSTAPSSPRTVHDSAAVTGITAR